MNMLNHVQAFKKSLEEQFPQLLKEEKQAIPIVEEFKLGDYSARAVQASWNVFFHLEKYLTAWVSDPQKLAKKLLSNLEAINDAPWMVCVVDETGLALAETLKKYINARLEQKDLLKEGGACLALALKIFPQIAASATGYLIEMKDKLDYEIKKYQFQKRLEALIPEDLDDDFTEASIASVKAKLLIQKAFDDKQEASAANLYSEAKNQLAVFLQKQQALQQLLQEINNYLATPVARKLSAEGSTVEQQLNEIFPLAQLSNQKKVIENKLVFVNEIVSYYQSAINFYEAEIRNRAQQPVVLSSSVPAIEIEDSLAVNFEDESEYDENEESNPSSPIDVNESGSENESDDDDDSSPEIYSTPPTAPPSPAPSPKAASLSGALSKENNFSLPPVAKVALPSAALNPYNDEREDMFVADADSVGNGQPAAPALISISIRPPATPAAPPASKSNFSIVISDAKSDSVVHQLLNQLNQADAKHSNNQEKILLDYIQANIKEFKKYTSSDDEKFNVEALHHKLLLHFLHVQNVIMDINSYDNCLKQLEKLINGISASVENANFIKNFLQQLATTIEILKEQYLVAKLQEICARYQQTLNAQLTKQASSLSPEAVARFRRPQLGEQLDFNATRSFSLNPKDDKQTEIFYRDVEVFQAITALQRDLTASRNPASSDQRVKSNHGKLVHFKGEFDQFMEKGFSVPIVEDFARDVRKEIVRFDEGVEPRVSPSVAVNIVPPRLSSNAKSLPLSKIKQQPVFNRVAASPLPVNPVIKSNSWWNNILGGICCTLGAAGIASGFLAIPGAVLLAIGATLLIGQPIKEALPTPSLPTVGNVSARRQPSEIESDKRRINTAGQRLTARAQQISGDTALLAPRLYKAKAANDCPGNNNPNPSLVC